MGGANPANDEALAAAGDPGAIARLQQRAAAMQGGMQPAAPAGAAPGMSQAEFSGYGRPQAVDPMAKQRQDEIFRQLLRQQGR
jgi:hypothetical protein